MFPRARVAPTHARQHTPLVAERVPSRDDLDALRDGASALLQMGNHVAALSLLWSAVAIDPTDCASHRRLAAALATAGDADGAAEEFARYIEFMVPLGDLAAAIGELSFAVSVVGGHPALHDAAERISASVRTLVPPPGVTLPAPSRPAIAASASQPAPERPALVPAATPVPAPRLLPKVPFRFCLHAAEGEYRMRLEGGVRGLVPSSVRALDASDNVIDHRQCLPLVPGQGHALGILAAPPVTWTVLALPAEIAQAFLTTHQWAYRFEAMVGGDWLALDMTDAPCRLLAKTGS